MANQGWPSTAGDGPAKPSNCRTTGRVTPTDAAASFVEGAKDAFPGQWNDPLDSRSDLKVAAYPLSKSDGVGGDDSGQKN